jgi:hypothetical protein
MAASISLREDFDGPMLRALVLSEKAGTVTRRLLALVTIYDGGARPDAARLGGAGLQTLRDWVLRFNARGRTGSSMANRPGVLACSITHKGARSSPWSKPVRPLRFMRSYAGD